jgi:predicted DNA-binding transcriptional regulator AlpA
MEEIQQLPDNNESNDDALWTEHEYAAFMKRSLTAVRRDRSDGTGPPYLKFGFMVRYDPAAVREWMQSKLITHTKAGPLRPRKPRADREAVAE